MKKTSILALMTLILVALGACSNKNVTPGSYMASSLAGKWDIVNVVVNDTLTVPATSVQAEEPMTMTFLPDNTFSAQTNCNIVGGNYALSGNSLKFTGVYSTRMACPDMRTEMYLGQVLPAVNGYRLSGDNQLVLTTPTSNSYVVLRKAGK